MDRPMRAYRRTVQGVPDACPFVGESSPRAETSATRSSRRSFPAFRSRSSRRSRPRSWTPSSGLSARATAGRTRLIYACRCRSGGARSTSSFSPARSGTPSIGARWSAGSGRCGRSPTPWSWGVPGHVHGRLVRGRLCRQAAGRLECFPWYRHAARPHDRATAPLIVRASNSGGARTGSCFVGTARPAGRHSRGQSRALLAANGN